MAQRPKEITILAVFDTVVGGLTVIYGLFLTLTGTALLSRSDVAVAQGGSVLSQGFTYLLLGAVLLVAGLGLFRLARWARVLNFVLAWVLIVFTGISFLGNVLIGAGLLKIEGVPSPTIGFLLAQCVEIAIPVIAVVLLRKPESKAAFAPRVIETAG